MRAGLRPARRPLRSPGRSAPRPPLLAALLAALLLLALLLSGQPLPAQYAPPASPDLVIRQAVQAGRVRLLPWRVVRELPHDRTAFTQGLVYDPERRLLLESAGRYGLSDVRQVSPETGAVLRRQPGPPEVFHEGLTLAGGRLYLLTWRERTGYVLDPASLARLGVFAHDFEGWGLTFDGRSLIASDGGDSLRFLDPADGRELRQVRVRAGGRPLVRLNELEYVAGQGKLWANVWMTDYLVRVAPATGEVDAALDLAGLLPAPWRAGADVLNGVASDPATGRLYVTGKLWPKMYEIEVGE